MRIYDVFIYPFKTLDRSPNSDSSGLVEIILIAYFASTVMDNEPAATD